MSLWRHSFELMAYGLLVICALDAWRRRGLLGLWQLGAGVAFGLLLEWGTIQQLQAYEYGRFLIMLGDVPLGVGVGWGVIIYSARSYSDAVAMPDQLRPILDGLLALNIDLSMDAIAIRLGMWQWGIGSTEEYFGVPYANFWAWFWVVSSFSAGSRAMEAGQGRVRRWLAPLTGIVVGSVVVFSTNQLIVDAIPSQLYLPAIAGVLGLALLLVLAARLEVEGPRIPKTAWMVPLGFHLYFLIAGLVSGTFSRLPPLLLVSLAMTSISVYLHKPWVEAQK